MEKQQSNWTTWWARAQRGLGLFPEKCRKNSSVCLKNLPKSQKIRLKFSAYYDEEDIKLDSIVLKDKVKECFVTFQSQISCVIQAGHHIFSDEIDISLFDQDNLTIEYKLINYCVSGFDFMDYDEFTKAPSQIYALSQIDLFTDELSGCICIFGDSIVEQGNYTRIIKEEMNKQGISILNLGISGNRLLRKIERVDLSKTDNRDILNSIQVNKQVIKDIPLSKQCFGISGIDRFKNDVLSCANVRLIIIAIGVNDLYQPGTFCASRDELPQFEEMIAGYEDLAIYTSSLLFCGITSFIGNPYYSNKKEDLRSQINEYLVNKYNTVLLDEILVNRNEVFNEDMLHPNLVGGKLIAKEVLRWLSL